MYSGNFLQICCFQRLYKAGEKKWGTDEATFFKILTQENYAQLQIVFKEYKTISSHEFEIALKKEFSGDVYKALIAVGRFI